MSKSESLHPHADDKAKGKTTCGDLLKRFDEQIMRPMLIHKYEAGKEAREQDFYDLYQQEGNAVRKMYEAQKTRKIEEERSFRKSQSHHGSEKKDD